jgi:L-lactate dehydrogenase complex protein LldG
MAGQTSDVSERRELLGLFERYAMAAGAQVTYAPDAGTAAALIAAMAGEQVKCRVEVCQLYPGLCSALAATGLAVTVSDDSAGPDASRSEVAAALAGGVGIVAGKAGVAETGSVLLADDSLAARLLSMLADTCVVILADTSIVGDLDAAGELIAELDRQGHRYMSMVTGPSRTADIERVLTIGVQGPKVLHIVVLQQEG